ncbi:MAG: hypothetical protein OEV21_00505 [Thermoplasmata archaeon]|nr:hypothetical protein [Thermoplasmata archaeon]
MPISTSGRLCPICDSPLEPGAKKCSFCGTDLTIFNGEAKGALRAEDAKVKETYSQVSEKEQIPAPVIESIEKRPSEAEGAGRVFECPACNRKVTESDKVCPHCGAIFEEEAQFECPACGTTVMADASKCPGCGAIFLEEGQQVSEEAAKEVSPGELSPDVQPEIVAVGESEAEKAAAEARKDEELQKIISAAKKIKDTRDADKGKKGVLEKKKTRKGFGLFKGILQREGPAEKKQATPAPVAQEQEARAEISEMHPEAEKEQPAELGPHPPPRVKKTFPTDSREQGRDLARLVAEVRSLLNTATERGIFMDETKALLDQAITAGRERQFIQALELISEGQERLQAQLHEYVSANIVSLQDEVVVAKKLGGDSAKANVYIREASRGGGSGDYQAALVFIDKARNELSPVTGRYNETKNALRKFERLVKDVRVIGIDNEPLKALYEDAKSAFDSLDFSKAHNIIKKNTDEIISQIPNRMSKEIDKAKQLLIEAKMKTDGGVSTQISILKSAIRNMQEEKYVEALAELKKFKKEMRRLLTPT